MDEFGVGAAASSLGLALYVLACEHCVNSLEYSHRAEANQPDQMVSEPWYFRH